VLQFIARTCYLVAAKQSIKSNTLNLVVDGACCCSSNRNEQELNRR